VVVFDRGEKTGARGKRGACTRKEGSVHAERGERARGKRGACDAWTEQVREPHLNNTHTHTL